MIHEEGKRNKNQVEGNNCVSCLLAGYLRLFTSRDEGAQLQRLLMDASMNKIGRIGSKTKALTSASLMARRIRKILMYLPDLMRTVSM
jgi:hypothetical protein